MGVITVHYKYLTAITFLQFSISLSSTHAHHHEQRQSNNALVLQRLLHQGHSLVRLLQGTDPFLSLENSFAYPFPSQDVNNVTYYEQFTCRLSRE